jgi:hypothetical protein
VLVANLAQGPDGRWSTLDGRRLYTHARATSLVYQAVLRSELTRELGMRWLSVRDGIAEIAGVPKPVLKEFSRRRADIEAALELSRTSGPRASEAAGLATRQAKDRRTSFQALQRDWRERAAAREFGRDELHAILHSRVTRELTDARLDDLFAQLAGPTGSDPAHGDIQPPRCRAGAERAAALGDGRKRRSR